MINWPIKFFGSGEEQVCLERLDDLKKVFRTYNPEKKNLYAALKATPFDNVRVAIIGQDPYPQHSLATGIAFSVPVDASIPASLETIFTEYCADLHYPKPLNGSLLQWTKQGVLLWNACPTCEAGKPLSHWHWDEWKYITKEIIQLLNPCGVVFVFVGSKAKEFLHYVDQDINHVIEVAHPSPRNKISPNLKHPFVGSRLFSMVNDRLCQLKKNPIDWRL